MSQLPFFAEIKPGVELEPMEYVLTPEMVLYYAIGIDNRHPWFVENSPFGGPIAPPTMVHVDQLRFSYTRLIHRPEEAGVHTKYDAQYFNPARVGEKITIRGRCVANTIRRGRRYVTLETETFGEDGRPIARYRDTHLVKYGKEEE
ncbi:MAG: hotdog fold domain-containing protein [Chloroflexota bacterium]|nr:hotdog fold domain-containing protein [Chloroflexota bacterium]